MKISVTSRAFWVHQFIRQLLSPWQVTFTSLDEAEFSIVYGEKPPEKVESVVIPSYSKDFTRWLKNIGLSIEVKNGIEFFVHATQQTVLSMTPNFYYHYEGSIEYDSFNNQPFLIKLDNVTLLTIDVIKEYSRIMDEILNPNVSNLYRILTSLPIPYRMAPRGLRDFFMRRKTKETTFKFCDKLPLDFLRFLLIRAIGEVTREKLVRKKWNGKQYVFSLTHDIDTYNGLKKAVVLKKLEDRYDIPSAWYIPTKKYKLEADIIRDLANHGEIGAHGTSHDGKLVKLPKLKIIKRLCEAKQNLETIIGEPVEGFRAPLLQFNVKFIQALVEAGYLYDASVPTWEPTHPYTMKPHGIGTVNLVKINGFFEIPLTFPQDHQMLYILCMTPEQTVETWSNILDVVRDIGGICTILIHPDYNLANSGNLTIYEEMLSNITADNRAWITIPRDCVRERAINS